MILKSGITFILFLSLLTTVMSQTDEWADVVITTEKLDDHMFLLQGRGGNILVQIGDEGVLVIDSQFAPLSDKIHAAIRKLSDGDIRYLINTHWHGDHTGGNEAMSGHGATIIAHENVLKRMSTEQLMKAFSRTVPASPENARPDITFSDNMSVTHNGEPALIYHFENGHTDGDAVIYFPESNVIHLGDLFFNGRYPFIDVGSGGSMDGVINAINQILFIVNDRTQIIPGHGALANRGDLTTYRDVLQLVRSNVHDAIAAGKTQEEIRNMPVGGDYEVEWGKQWIKGKDLVDVIMSRMGDDQGVE